MSAHVTCIILNYNEWEITQKCISSLEQSSHQNFNIVLIDNHSSQSHPSILFNAIEHPLFDNFYINKQFKNNIQITKKTHHLNTINKNRYKITLRNKTRLYTNQLVDIDKTHTQPN